MLLDGEFSGVRVNPTRSLRLRNNDMLLDRFNRAAKRIWIANAYFVPSGSMIEALTAAARSAVSMFE
jgi:phosphatidylserine/phosphatidylglycerophosphate/cardiolipin synthase-like enzyme